MVPKALTGPDRALLCLHFSPWSDSSLACHHAQWHREVGITFHRKMRHVGNRVELIMIELGLCAIVI